jgi:hypothetical protein
MSSVTKLSLPPRSLAIGTGHELAQEMFDELLGEDYSGSAADQALLDPEYRRGMPYRDIVFEYLQRAREAGPDVERGFTMILADMIATVAQSGVPDDRYYESLFRRRVIADGPEHAARREKARALRLARRERRSSETSGARP